MNVKVSWSGKHRKEKLSLSQLKTSAFWFYSRYYAEVNISTYVNLEIFPKSKMHHGKKRYLLDRKVD